MSAGDHDVDRLIGFASANLLTAKLPEEQAGAPMIAACALMVKAGFERANAIRAAGYVIHKFFNTMDEIAREEMS